MATVRLKSSFIYLANAVHDFTGNLRLIALVLAPLVIAASLCLLPDALNLQHQVVETFQPGTQSVAWHSVQTPYYSAQVKPPLFPLWEIRTLHILFFLITLTTNLVVLCALSRIQSANYAPESPLQQAVAIYQRAVELAPAFFWVFLLRLFVTASAIARIAQPVQCVSGRFAQLQITVPAREAGVLSSAFELRNAVPSDAEGEQRQRKQRRC